MSGLPPVTPGTPSQEWARSTTTAAFARTEPAPASNPSGGSISAARDAQKGPFDPSMTESPFPGAYPVTPGDNTPQAQVSIQDSARNAAQQASAFVQSAATTAAQYIPQGVVDTVTSYIPTSSATATMSSARASEHDAEHTTSFPTTELSGAGNGERVGGVGALPGPLNEAAVAKLPEERSNEEQYTTVAGAAAIAAGGAYAIKDRVVDSLPSQDQAKHTAQQTMQSAQKTAQSAQETALSTVQTAKQSVPGAHSTAVTASTLPTREPFGAQPGDHSLGVGALPGHQSESHVALLPEESAHPQYDSGPVDTTAQVALKPSEEAFGNESAVGEMRNVAGVGALVGGRSEEGVALLPDERERERDRHAVDARDEQPKALVKADTERAVFAPSQQSQPDKVPVAQANQEAKTPDVPQKESSEKKEADVSGQKGETNKLPGKPGSSPLANFDEAGEDVAKPRDVQTDLLHATLRPRAHALGVDSARWGDEPLSGKRAREVLVNDADDCDVHDEGSGYDTTYHPAALHPSSEGASDPAAHASEGEKSLGATQADARRPQEEQHPPHSDDANDPHKRAEKASFMKKMQGKADVIIGKITRNPEMIEKGKDLKAGPAQSA